MEPTGYAQERKTPAYMEYPQDWQIENLIRTFFLMQYIDITCMKTTFNLIVCLDHEYKIYSHIATLCSPLYDRTSAAS